jgi:hypothetical protein
MAASGWRRVYLINGIQTDFLAGMIPNPVFPACFVYFSARYTALSPRDSVFMLFLCMMTRAFLLFPLDIFVVYGIYLSVPPKPKID